MATTNVVNPSGANTRAVCLKVTYFADAFALRTAELTGVSTCGLAVAATGAIDADSLEVADGTLVEGTAQVA